MGAFIICLIAGVAVVKVMYFVGKSESTYEK